MMTARISVPIRGDSYECREDGYVYSATGERLRKWFGSLWSMSKGSVCVWLPSLQPARLSHIEGVLHRLDAKFQRGWTELQKLAAELHARGGVGHVLVPNVETGVLRALAGDRNHWREYTTQSDRADPAWISWSFQWLDTNPERALESELTRRLYEREQYVWYSLSRRLAVARAVFENVVQQKLALVRSGKLARLRINGRAYYYARERERASSVWKELCAGQEAIELKA